MTIILVVLMFLVFLVTDVLVREITRRYREANERRTREKVLDASVRLDFTHEAKTLKRVEVPNPKARVLAVDDESIVLDSFRRILTLEGFNVDTVETGREALGLVQRHDYDFVFTDLKMPDMDGIEVVKAVKHLRPDVDVVVITGYGTIETAVQTIQYGACEYVQKPFSAEELGAFASKLLVKRQARMEAQRRPTVRIVSPSDAERIPSHEYCVPGGVFITAGHAWARIEASGQIRVGIDDFARKALGVIETVVLPERGREVHQGEPLFSLTHGSECVHFVSPVSGRILKSNETALADPSLVMRSPYDKGWICLMEPKELANELSAMKIGKPAMEWYQEEITRLRTTLSDSATGPVAGWPAFEKAFLGSGNKI